MAQRHTGLIIHPNNKNKTKVKFELAKTGMSIVSNASQLVIDKVKPLFFGRLRRAMSTSFHIQIFNIRIAQILTGQSNQLSLIFFFNFLPRKCDLIFSRKLEN